LSRTPAIQSLRSIAAAKAVVAIVNLEPLLKFAWFIIMLALLSEYFAEYKDEPKNL